MANQDEPRYRYRGNVKPTEETKRPVKAYRNATSSGANGSKSTSATIDIFDVIDSWGGWWGISAAEVDAALTGIGKVDTLFVRVNSPGGEATEGIAIANLLRAHAAEIRTTVYGLAASAASYISTAGDTVSMAPGSMFMIHEAWNVVRGNADDLRAEADVLDALGDSIASLYALKAGGKASTWRNAMKAETWYTAAAAVEAKLADKIGIEAAPPPANAEAPTLDDSDDAAPFDRAAAIFDLSVFTNAPRSAADAAPKTPAEPAASTPNPKEADAMSDTIIKGLRERLGIADDVEMDDEAVLAKYDELTSEAVAALAAKPDPVDPPHATVPDGMKLVPEAYLDSLKEGSEAGKAALARQDREDRDKAIRAAQDSGRLSRAESEVETWHKTWDRLGGEESAKWLSELPVRYPVNAEGYSGSDGTDGEGTIPADEAAALATLFGGPKEAFI